jgi:iron(III) transport system substrate-binding protein
MTTLATLGLEGSFNRDEFEPWLRQVKDSAVVLGGNKQVAVAVSSGELSWGLTDTDDALIELEGGAPVAVVYPDQGPNQAGCLMIPGTVAVVKNGPHRIAAKLLADYLSSAETERRLTLGNAAQFAIWPSNDKSIAKKAADMKTMNVDFEEVAKNWDNTFSLLQKVFP